MLPSDRREAGKSSDKLSQKRENEHLGQGSIGQLKYSKQVWLFLRGQWEAITMFGTEQVLVLTYISE